MTDHLSPLRPRWMGEPLPTTSSRVLGGENRILKEQMEGRRIRLTDDHRRRLATKGQRLGRRVLQRVATIVTPDTILRWYRRLIAQKWTSECRRPGRPRVLKEIAALIVRMATENSPWRYNRIQGAPQDLGHRVA